jgi:hypothetical protein
MFTWICPKCGREVPPAYTECPDCSGKTAAPAANAPEDATSNAPGANPPEPAGATPGATRRRPVWSDAGAHSQAAAPPPVSAPPPPQTSVVPVEPVVAPAPPFSAIAPPPAPGRRFPTWLLTIVFALVFAGIVFGVYKLVNRTPSKPTAVVESPAAKPGAPANPIQRYIEVSGVRFLEDPKKKDTILVKFVLTNHSDADFPGLAGNVTIWGSTRRSEEDAFGSFSFKTDIKPNESKELTEPLTTKKKIYELPDWQNATADVQITAPTG